MIFGGRRNFTMPLSKPIYLRGEKPPTGKRFSSGFGTIVFILLLLGLYYAVFFRSENQAAQTIEEKLQKFPALPEENLKNEDSAPSGGETEILKVVEGSFNKGDTPSSVLARLGVRQEEIFGLVKALGNNVDLRGIKEGQKIKVMLREDGRAVGMEYPLNKVSYISITGENGLFTSEKKEIPAKLEVVKFGCMIKYSLYESIQRCGEDASLVAQISEILSWDVDFFQDVRRGDILRVIVEKYSVNGDFLQYGKVLGVEYNGKFGNFIAVYFNGTGDNKGYYNDKGFSVEKPFLKSPMRYSKVTSDFSKKRFHPILHTWKSHQGVDYSVAKGTPVWAVGEGEVVYKGYKGANGNLVVISHANGFKTHYAHLSKFASGLKIGSKVSQKEVIGYVGSTGRATGPHLHFAVSYKGKFIHPKKLKSVSSSSLPQSEMEAFKKTLNEIKALLKSVPVRGIIGAGA